MGGPATASATSAVLGIAVGLLILAWSFASPPGVGPDEVAHYGRALGAGGGDLVGTRYEPTPAERDAFRELAESRRSAGIPDSPVSGMSLLWSAELTRTFRVPRRLGATPFGCNVQRPTESAACLDRQPAPVLRSVLSSNTGTYQPFAYLLPGAVMHLADEPAGALRLGRLVSAVTAAILLALAIAALAAPRRGALSLLGTTLAVTPMTVFSASLLNASGTEIAGAILVMATLLRLTRADDAPRWIGVAFVLGALVLVLSRFFGPAMLGLMVAAVVAARGAGSLRAFVSARRRLAVVGGALILAATVAGVAWQLVVMPHPEVGAREALAAVLPSVAELPGVMRQAIGDFGSLDTPLPAPVVLLWWSLAAALLVGALALGRARERVALAGLTAVVLVFTVLVDVGEHLTGFSVQGRHVLPALVAIPLLSGEVLWARCPERRAALLTRLAGAAVVLAALAHFVAWWVNARRWAVGTDGPWLFVGTAEWAPPAGWGSWAAVAGIATASIAVAAIALAREASRPPRRVDPVGR